MPNQSAVVFMMYNRPDLLKQSFKPISNARPPRLYLIGDGPKTNDEDYRKVMNTRQTAESMIDWPCEVFKIYADSNMGCGRRISSGLTEVFSCEDQAIIIEDDCVAHEDFFPYCNELLDRYRNDPEVMHIGGNHFLNEAQNEFSYFFSKYSHCWGWASWSRAWQRFDFNLDSWKQKRKDGRVFMAFDTTQENQYWSRTFDFMLTEDAHDTWDIQWSYAVMEHGLAIYPNVNLVSNIGDGLDSTHTKDNNHDQLHIPTQSILPISSPSHIQQHLVADLKSFEKIFKPIKLHHGFEGFDTAPAD